ncbi:MAG: DJ-1/PfpI family protein [Candidatus Marsarchaeota archaeon]|jgi:putative intracellular protease/amidase|nr:DJ-1/PfpI family protein [Candidatus Marsarchaeota archaeon]
MNVAIIIPPKDFRDETVTSALQILSRWGVTSAVASTTLGECIGYHGARLNSVFSVPEITTENFDAIFISDGMGVDSFKLYDSRQLLDVLKHFNSKKKPIACVGNAIKILARANVINNIKIASVKEPETSRLVRLFRGIITNNEIEACENILTSSNSNSITNLVDALLDRLNVR